MEYVKIHPAPQSGAGNMLTRGTNDATPLRANGTRLAEQAHVEDPIARY